MNEGTMTREELEMNVAESIRAVAEHVIASADNYAKVVDGFTRHVCIRMEFNINEMPTVSFSQDGLPGVWLNAVRDQRCHVWTDGGAKE